MRAIPIEQIARAVESVGGDMEDVADLIDCYQRMQDRLAEANRLDQAGDHAAADRIGDKLERDYAQPLRDIAAERVRRRGKRGR